MGVGDWEATLDYFLLTGAIGNLARTSDGYGRFSPNLTNEKKSAKWKEIFEDCLSIGIQLKTW
uniref:Uncharacterized protein n=1 Tax=Romanomermis culicivorax TaxID=13658 RepID=A0A915KPB7_ROMCU